MSHHAPALGLLLACLFGSASGLAQEPAASATATAPVTKAYFWFGLWPDRVVKFDPEIDEIVGDVKLRNGLFFGLRLTHDKKRFLAITAQRAVVEVVDRASMSVTEEHPFLEEGFISRVDRVMECPGGTHWYVQVNRVKQELDHYRIEKDQWLYYDIANRKVEKRMERLPREIRSGARISPCGTKWHVFGRDIKILDGKTMKEEGVIKLSEPLYAGMGPLRVRGEDLLDGEDATRYRMLYSMRDPVKTTRTIAGVVDIDLEGRRVDKLTEWGHDPGLRLRLSHDKKRGVGSQGLGGGRGGGDSNEVRVVLWDVDNGVRIRDHVFEIRPRGNVSGLSPDGSKIYIGGAGNDFAIYDDHFNLLRTVYLDGDLYGGIHVLED